MTFKRYAAGVGTAARAAAAAAAALVAVLAVSCGIDDRPIPDGPNVLIITADTLRADHLGCYGLPGGHTPHIDGLAASGTLFRNCTAPIATTFPSHSTIFSALYPRYHGVRWNGHSLDSGVETLAEILHGQGWDTAAFVAFKAMLVRGGLGQGFETVSDEDGVKTYPRIRGGEKITDLFADWLASRDPERPFFTWLHYFEPHSPYPVTPYAREAMARDGYAGPLVDGATVDMLKKFELFEDAANRRALEHLYTGRVRETDGYIGEVLGHLAGHGLDQDTIVIFTSDHGQMLGENIGDLRRVGHGAILYEPAVRVPLIIRDPSRSDAGPVDVQVGLVDIMPTVLDLLGLDVPTGIHGRSIRPVLEGGAIEEATYLAEIRVPQPETKSDNWVDRIAVYEKGMKVVFPDGLVYDLSARLPDFKPVPAGDHAEMIARLKKVAKRFFDHRSGHDSGYDLDEDDFAELRALGYIK
jgi:arylsulfatase A-like enzyme